MDYIFRKSTESDLDGIADVLGHAKNTDLSPAERAKAGFVQGTMTRQSLGERIARPHFGAIVAVDNANTVVATCLYSPCPRDTQADHPTAGVARVVADSDIPATDILMFGPMAVDSPAQGKGTARKLITAVHEHASTVGATHIASFVEHSNERSMGLHQHLGFTVLGSFQLHDKDYSVFVQPVN
ncbi:GNAT family N-acetyltransferase [Corynebacterium rouxii]|uniref:GNAT family N-acetyltransferase n=1 Tax=Corynebacterium rouxii TaxID=2719119 RepID=A0ABU3PP42_9CORY|nr:GNAT family N-acetyltransferase [Corynebacterium rouxii]MDT9409362.1 GNAT family N-acetyltransferase [Corynebacterium rouxii]MDT9411596.1 GNAT family N-acetyltransferase [Corynebacterium rouxii]